MCDRSPHEIKPVSQCARMFPARLDAFPLVAAFVEEVCGAASFGRDDRLRLTLILEELFTNTVEHGHGGDSEAPVHIALDVQPGRVGVTYEDTGPRFDPFAAGVEPPDADVALDLRPVGGLGLLLVFRMSASVEYTRLVDRNRIALVVTASR